MPFDGSGNFSRLYNWQNDRDGGIRILASRMDAEFNNFAGGMNQVFFRNGLVPMSGNLSLGSNSITGVAAGSVGAPSYRFADDPNTGVFLNGIGNYCIVAGGTTRLATNSTGLNVTGQLGVFVSSPLAGTRIDIASATNATQATDPALRIRSASNTVAANYCFDGIGASGTYVFTADGTQVARFTSSGWVFNVPLAVGSGGTGSASAEGARINLGLGTAALNNTGDFKGISEVESILRGGTGASNALGALANLGAQPALGYTAANRAGDSFTGACSIVSGATATPALILTTGGPNQGQMRLGNSVFLQGGDDYVGFRVVMSGVTQAYVDTSGNFTANGNITALSDKRFKSNIRELTDSLAAVNLMRPVRYTDNRTGGDRVGFVAQDMQQVRPQYVVTDDKGYLSIAYGNITADLVGAVQKLSRTVDTLRRRIEVLEAR